MSTDLVPTHSGRVVVARQTPGRHPNGNGRRPLLAGPQDAADRLVAIAANRRKLSALLGRDVSFAVAALDYLLHVSRELAEPGSVELEVLDLLDRRLMNM